MIQVRSLGREDPLKEGTATHSSILTWEIPRTEEPERLQSMGSQQVRHHWVTNTYACSFFHYTLPFPEKTLFWWDSNVFFLFPFIFVLLYLMFKIIFRKILGEKVKVCLCKWTPVAITDNSPILVATQSIFPSTHINSQMSVLFFLIGV